MSFSVGTHLVPHPEKVSQNLEAILKYEYFNLWFGHETLSLMSDLTSHFLPNGSSNLFLTMDCSKADKGGEDAFFVSSYNGGVLAIADGVSG